MKTFAAKNLVGLLLMLMTVIGSPHASALAGVYGQGNPEQPTSNPQWPVGVTELVNQADRVGGYWINSSEWYYFNGDTPDFNNFLAKYSRLKGTPLTLVLHVGKGPTLSEWAHTAVATPSVWQVSVIDNTWTEQAVHGKMTPKTHYTVTINLWLNGQVDLDGLKIPAGIAVKSGGEIETFIAQHH